MIKSKLNHQNKSLTTKQKILKFIWGVGTVFTCCGVWFCIYAWHWEYRAHVMEVHMFLVDGNIAVFIRTSNNHTLLIDGGKSNSVLKYLAMNMPFYRHDIYTVILSKDDDSHATGLVDVLDRYHVAQIVEMQIGNLATSTAYDSFEKDIAGKKIPDRRVQEGDYVDVGDPSVSLRVLFPPVASSSFKFSKTNIPQLAFQIQYGDTSFVFSDLTKTEQKYVASSSEKSQLTTVLISQHAGGASALFKGYIDTINPEYTVIAKKPSTAHKVSKLSRATYTATTTNFINLVEEENITFISDGKTVVKGK